ncbi:hypothetical protein GCM10010156_65000 [Planobispora rosea]|uniref:4Fe-4S Wbl-type domain-containing protein n=1 Tax=Planobispora rosea TaxID=35762 RepID=A0A8J3S3N0_PLARO|nr:WhiB family transcriptional regulator [Planobispora rosea]GGS97792.1 hypothetical protein GCM10010156_65000 [Planobispora rosea]GIH87821.1 hypothetical protein Pro02_62290 [Planobispora rosea]
MSNIFAAVLKSVYAQSTAVLARQVILHGACVGSSNPDAWFPPEPTSRSDAGKDLALVEYEATARQLCGSCPVRAECLELALREEYDLPRSWFHGIRGGAAPWERQTMVSNRRRTARRLAARQTAPDEAVA